MLSHTPQGASGQRGRVCKDRVVSSHQVTPWQRPQLPGGKAKWMPSAVLGQSDEAQLQRQGADWQNGHTALRHGKKRTSHVELWPPSLQAKWVGLGQWPQGTWEGWDCEARSSRWNAPTCKKRFPLKAASVPSGLLSVLLAYRHKYEFLHSGMTPDIRITVPPKRIGILLDYKNCKLSFFNADIAQHLYTFSSQFQHYVHPCFALETPGILRIHTGIATPPWTALP